MADKIEVPPVTKILSLDEARAAIAGKVPVDAGLGGMKRNADKEFVLTTALTVATGVCERVYNLMSEQQAEGLAKVEFMVLQHIQEFEKRQEARTLRGRLRRLWTWAKSFRVLPSSEEWLAVGERLHVEPETPHPVGPIEAQIRRDIEQFSEKEGRPAEWVQPTPEVFYRLLDEFKAKGLFVADSELYVAGVRVLAPGQEPPSARPTTCECHGSEDCPSLSGSGVPRG